VCTAVESSVSRRAGVVEASLVSVLLKHSNFHTNISKKQSDTKSIFIHRLGEKKLSSLSPILTLRCKQQQTQSSFSSLFCAAKKKGDLTRQTTLSIVEEFSISNSACVCVCVCAQRTCVCVSVKSWRRRLKSVDLFPPFFCCVAEKKFLSAIDEGRERIF